MTSMTGVLLDKVPGLHVYKTGMNIVTVGLFKSQKKFIRWSTVIYTRYSRNTLSSRSRVILHGKKKKHKIMK